MGSRGPLGRDRRQRPRDNASREALMRDDVVRGPALPDGVLGSEDEPWHPMVVRWWETFRRSPMAQRVTEDVQWETLIAAMMVYQDIWSGGVRGRVTRVTEFRAFVASYFVTPGDLRRHGLEVVLPSLELVEDGAPEDDPAAVTSLEARRERLVDD